MIIGINGFEAVIPRFGYNPNGLPNRVGSSEVGFELLLKLSEIDKNNEYVIYLPSFPTPDMPKESERWHYEIVPNVPLWTILGLGRKLLVKPRLDVFFSPSHYGPLFTSCPQVITILDLSYKYFPELFKKSDLLKLALWGKYSIKKAAKIITISQSSRNDIIKEYRAGPDKVSVVYPGIKQVSSSKYKVFSMKQLTEKYGINSPFILFVGTLQPRKNISRLIEAFFRMVSNGDLMDSNLQLVIIGRRGWKYEEILEAPKKFGVEDKVLFLDNVTDEDLPEFYKNAKCFVLPSLYEGFGLPILEAMQYGCPVLTSNISSLPEAGGDAAIYFDPYDVNDMADKIKKVLEDESLRAKMKKEGFKQIKKFSWEKSAREVLRVLEEAAK